MALSNDTRPHFTTIADFVATMDKEIIPLFRDVLFLCEKMGLIGKEMFAIDGCKLPSNASKQWSGTKDEFKKKSKKLEKAIKRMLDQHKMQDGNNDEEHNIKEKRYLEKLNNHLAKLKEWQQTNDDKLGHSGKPIKSNITDNGSAKMKTSKGIIQGYDGVTTVDSKYQIIVHAEAYGQGQEHNLLLPMVNSTRENFIEIGAEEDIFTKAKLSADAGFHSESNLQKISDIDAYIADNQFRKRDPRFADYDRYKERHRKELARHHGSTTGLFTPKDFTFPKDLSHCICPAGKKLYRSGHNVKIKNNLGTKFKGPKSACLPCQLRKQCLRKPEHTEIRQVAFFHGKTEKGKSSFTEKMKKKIDSSLGRMLYGMRLAVAEPPFAHICNVMGLKRFSHRGKTKVNIQWNLFCILHNLKKIHRYASGYA